MQMRTFWRNLPRSTPKRKQPTRRTSLQLEMLETRVVPATFYVNDNWFIVQDIGTPGLSAGDTVDNSNDAGAPSVTATFGTDAFDTIANGIAAAGVTGDTVHVLHGAYTEDVSVNKANLTLLGAGASNTTVSGPIGGDVATIRIAANNVTVAGFTITREGNNPTDWDNAGLNSAGIAVQGQAILNLLVRDNIIVGNRTGIDVNNSSGHTIRNNVITNNHTGMIFRNQTDDLTVVENAITENRTVGVLFLDASGGTNAPLQQALNSTFSNNNISGNWYGQIVDRQAGGSLPAPGSNIKNFSNNWLGTATPVVTTNNSAEPGYSMLIPVAFGGTATAPGGQPDIAGAASANIDFTPLLTSGIDTNIETAPGRGTFGFQGDLRNIARANSPVVFTDADGDIYEVRLFGPGTATVLLDDPDTDGLGSISQIILQNTTSASQLRVTLRKGGTGLDAQHVSIGEITGSGLRSISAPSSDLVGNGINLLGPLQSLVLRDVLNGADITTLGLPQTKTTIKINSIVNSGPRTEINIGTTLASFTANTVDDSGITAPSLGKLSIKGDFDADLEVGSIANARIGGGIDDAVWSVLGDIRSLRVTGGIEGWDLVSEQGSLLKAKLGLVNAAEIDVATSVVSFSATTFTNSHLFVGYTPTNAADPLAGGGSFSFFLPSTIRSFSITGSQAGAFANSTVAAKRLETVRLSSVDVDNNENGNVAFGFVADELVKSLRVTTPAFTVANLTVPNAPLGVGIDDFRVVLI